MDELTVKEAAEELQTTVQYIRNLVYEHKLNVREWYEDRKYSNNKKRMYAIKRDDKYEYFHKKLSRKREYKMPNGVYYSGLIGDIMYQETVNKKELMY